MLPRLGANPRHESLLLCLGHARRWLTLWLVEGDVLPAGDHLRLRHAVRVLAQIFVAAWHTAHGPSLDLTAAEVLVRLDALVLAEAELGHLEGTIHARLGRLDHLVYRVAIQLVHLHVLLLVHLLGRSNHVTIDNGTAPLKVSVCDTLRNLEWMVLGRGHMVNICSRIHLINVQGCTLHCP